MMIDLRSRRLPWCHRLIAVAFGLGSLEHVVGLVGLGVGWPMYSHYPWWRHAAFATVDGAIAWLAVRQPRRLFLPLAAFLVEQLATNGVETWQTWSVNHQLQWSVLVTLPLIAVAVVCVWPSFNSNPVCAAPNEH
jgi:hypothetical protein